jgi:hypothetical protein
MDTSVDALIAIMLSLNLATATPGLLDEAGIAARIHTWGLVTALVY